ncbi:MAG: TonB-dependent receptor [Rhodospirillaceae bacterium]|nr:TonB-dependent receptor [Rhodospirillaceae bacterium]
MSNRARVAHSILIPAVLLAATTAQAETEAPAKVEEAKIEEIVVTATPYASDPNALSTIVGQVNRNDILRGGGANLADALADVPGVTGSSFAAGASRPVIRGFDSTRVKVLENGAGSFDVADVGPDHGVPIDPLSTREIEVIRGAATLRYGSQAIGGVVNAINNRIPFADLDKPFAGEVSASAGTGANLYQGSALLDARSGRVAFHADGFGRHTGDYDIPGGSLSNSFFRGEGGSLGAAYIGEASKTGATVVRYQARYGIPGETSYIDMNQTKGLGRSTIDFDGGTFESLNIDAGYADYSHSEKDATGAADSTFMDKEWDSRVEAILAPSGALSAGAIGVQAQRRKFTALGEGADYLLPTLTKSAATFAFAETSFTPTLKLQAGARAEHVNVKGTPLSNVQTAREFTPLSGSLGLVLTPSSALTLGMTVASAARAPAQTELFARGPHDGPQTYELGDPALKIERSNSIEGSLRVDATPVHLEMSAWAAHFDNFIYGRLTGQTCDEEGDCAAGDANELRELVYTQGNAKFRGLEGKARVTVAKTESGSLEVKALADYVRATLSNAGNVPRIPPYHFGVGLDWTSAMFDAGVLWRRSGAQNKTAQGETPTDGFSTLEAELGFRPWPDQRDIEISLIGRNLTDTEQRNATAFNKDEILLPGRDVRLVLRAGF